MATEIIKFDTSVWQKSISKKIENRELKRIEDLAKISQNLKSFSHLIPVEKLYIFGSVTRKNMYNEHSDIDIAIKNTVKDVSFFKIWKQIEEICNQNIDLLDLDECAFAEIIESTAIKIK